jgi:glutathione-regulated potassium-efflux system ancillary protein KefG
MWAASSVGRRHAQPVEQRRHRDDNSPAETPAWDFSSTHCFVCCGPAKAEKRGYLFDGEGDPFLEIFESEGSGSLDHVGTSFVGSGQAPGCSRTAGATCLSKHQDYTLVILMSRVVDFRTMPTVDTTDLIDARGVAELLGLSHPNSVSTYQHRYPDMPRPVIDLGEGRCKLWLAADIRAWAKGRQAL